MASGRARNKPRREGFLAKERQEKGVKTTASGLQYKVIAAGRRQGAGDQRHRQVTVHYRGKLLDGTEFDSSYSRGVPATFPSTASSRAGRKRCC
jgi:FKBP-type peptidyl-prolyl cis-trans isomerase FklB